MKTVTIAKKYKLWFAISTAVIVLGIVLFIMNGLNLGIEFTGGTLMQIDLQQTVPVDEIKELLSTYELDPEVVHAGTEQNEIIIKTKQSLANEERLAIYQELMTSYGVDENAIRGTEQVGPSVGAEIRNRALLAVAIAAIAMLLYVSVRFETVFGLAAIIALIHDVLILLSLYAIFRITVNSSFIAAVLTIVGYSINDTIVVFDRIRENVKREKGTHFEIADISIGQTISRTINTSLTTLFVIGSLYFLGVSTIKEFALPLLIGVLVGTYSSIFIASPVWALLRHKIKSKDAYSSK
ncbi:protein translocase subunit SecF [Fusibacter tunisiensis]|uniref:Protein-export membrane protein SecF n=1 Tax=Fusibacter tunisiensis TaxID=1008308 RepID=A0ABS2MQF3_9FIRM|nr:protein translocase subunit SecF [Fusibacter tunisiensis]MBM7561619.1 preprotein translocase SecF subunit [Fusibacter tunisiensis]